MVTHNGTGTYACEKQLALLQRAGVFNIALARTRLPADKRRKKEALMENVFALTTMEKRKGVERAKTTGHQPGLRKRVDAGACPLPTRHARQTVWFLCEEKRKKRIR